MEKYIVWRDYDWDGWAYYDFDSLDEARKWIEDHPYSGETVLTELIKD